MTVSEGMVVNTQHTSEAADRAQKGVMELLLVNHPLDCPVCDKGGECPLQNQALSHGRPETRFVDVKRTFEKPIALSSEILLDRERCILCQRCTRFSKEIAGDPFIDLQNRGAQQQIGTFDEDVLDFDGYGPVGIAAEDESGKAFSSYYSGNTVQICPVGALTSAAYRFRARPFDLVSSPGISEHDSSGSALRTDHRRGKILRRLADNDPVVNEDWISDKDRFAFAWQNQADRITRPLVRKDGELVEVSWPEAIAAAAAGLRAAAGLTGTPADKKATTTRTRSSLARSCAPMTSTPATARPPTRSRASWAPTSPARRST
jgi:NADH-quinone oxidoreductase subunit G